MSSIDEIDRSQSFKSLIRVPALYQEPLRLPTAWPASVRKSLPGCGRKRRNVPLRDRLVLSRFLPVAPVPISGGPLGRRTKRRGTPAILAGTIDGPAKAVLFHNCRPTAERTRQKFTLVGIAHLALTLFAAFLPDPCWDLD